MTGPQGSPWKNPRIFLVLALVFLCGLATGALGDRLAFGAAQTPVKAWKEGGKEISLQRFTKELSLSTDQAKEMEVVLDDFMIYYQTVQAQMDDVRASGKERILKMLKPEQQEKFNRMMSELQAKVR